MRISIIYYSQTSNTEKAAAFIAEGIREEADIEVKLMNIADPLNVDAKFVNESAAVIFGTPTYVASMCWQLKKWFDEDWNCKLSGKVGAVFATANSMSGGADVAILHVISHLLVKGMLAYSSGAGCGRPYIHLGPIALRDELDAKKEMFMLFGKRVAQKAAELFSSEQTTDN